MNVASWKCQGPRSEEEQSCGDAGAQASRQLSWSRDPKARHPVRFTLEAVAIFSNILAGPGILALPAMVQKSGWVLSFLMLVVFTVMTAWISSLLSKALQKMTLQERTSGTSASPRYELADLVRATFGARAFVAFQVVLNAGMLLLCLASIVDAQQAFDLILVKLFGNSFALEFSGTDGLGLVKACSSGDCGSELFMETSFGVTAGYIFVCLLCLPLTFTNFANLMWFQYFVMVVTTLAICIFSVTCFLPSPSPIPPNESWFIPPAFGEDPSLAVSTCFFCFAISFAVPTWWNDNEPDCPATKAINTSMVYTIMMYYLPITVLPAFAFVLPTESAMDLFTDPDAVNQVCVFAALGLALIGIMPNIIAYSVAMRDNMQTLGAWFTFRKCVFLGCICPWLFGWSVSFGAYFQTVVQWTSIGVLGIINFIVPLILVLKLSRIQQEAKARKSLLTTTDGGVLVMAAVPREVEPWTSGEIVAARVMPARSPHSTR